MISTIAPIEKNYEKEAFQSFTRRNIPKAFVKYDSKYEAVRAIEHTTSQGKMKALSWVPIQIDPHWDERGEALLGGLHAQKDRAPMSLLDELTETEQSLDVI